MFIEKNGDQVQFENKWIKVWTDDVTFPNGEKGSWARIWRRDCVVVIPQIDAERCLMIREWRYPTCDWRYGFVVGAIEDGVTPEETAKKELQEETGATAEEFIALGQFNADPGLSSQIVHVYVARGLKRGETKHEDAEIIEVHEKTVGEIDDIFLRSTAVGSFSMSSYTKFVAWQKKQQ